MADSPRQLAKKIEKWAKVGYSYAIIRGSQLALAEDKRESIGRAPSRSGSLRGTIRVTTPSSKRTGRTGILRIGLSAGSRSQANPVPYASVLQRGLVGYPGKQRTRPHVIQQLPAGKWYGARNERGRHVGRQATGKIISFVVNGRRIFARRVQHPGSRFKALDYLKVNAARGAQYVDDAVGRSAKQEL